MKETIEIGISNSIAGKIIDFISVIKKKNPNIEIMYICEGGLRGWAKNSTYETSVELYGVYKLKDLKSYVLLGNNKSISFINSTKNITCRLYDISELIKMCIDGELAGWEIIQSKVIWHYSDKLNEIKNSHNMIFDPYKLVKNLKLKMKPLVYATYKDNDNIVNRIYSITKYYGIIYHVCKYSSLFPMDIKFLCDELSVLYTNNRPLYRYLTHISEIDTVGQTSNSYVISSMMKYGKSFYLSIDNISEKIRNNEIDKKELIANGNSLICKILEIN